MHGAFLFILMLDLLDVGCTEHSSSARAAVRREGVAVVVLLGLRGIAGVVRRNGTRCLLMLFVSTIKSKFASRTNLKERTVLVGLLR